MGWFRRKPRPSKTHVLAEVGGIVFVVKHRTPVLLSISRWKPAITASVIDMRSNPAKETYSVSITGKPNHHGLRGLISPQSDSLQVWVRGRLMMEVPVISATYAFPPGTLTIEGREDRSEW